LNTTNEEALTQGTQVKCLAIVINQGPNAFSTWDKAEVRNSKWLKGSRFHFRLFIYIHSKFHVTRLNGDSKISPLMQFWFYWLFQNKLGTSLKNIVWNQERHDNRDKRGDTIIDWKRRKKVLFEKPGNE
jgi:hypothetical protein